MGYREEKMDQLWQIESALIAQKAWGLVYCSALDRGMTPAQAEELADRVLLEMPEG